MDCVSLGSRIGFCLAVTGLFCVVFQNLFCCCWFCSFQYFIIKFGIFGCCLSHSHQFHICLFSISSGKKKEVRFVISSLNQCSSCRKIYSCCVFVFFYFSYLCHVFNKGEGTKEDSSSRMRTTKSWFGDFRTTKSISYSIFFFGKLTYVLKEEDTNIIRGIPQIYNDNRNIKQQMAPG